MRDSMRERIARALARARYPDAYITPNRLKEYKSLWRDADAVLDALMEPTEGMIDEGQNEVNLLENPEPPNAFEFLSNEEVVSIFQAMIRAAKEGK